MERTRRSGLRVGACAAVLVLAGCAGPAAIEARRDHWARDAERRTAADAPPARREGAAGRARSFPGVEAPAVVRDPAGGAAVPGDGAPDDDASGLRRRGERERGARRLRGGASSPVSVDVVPAVSAESARATAFEPRVPASGEPGGPPPVLPSCGPAGCFDAQGRAWPSAGGDAIRSPQGTPCLRTPTGAAC